METHGRRRQGVGKTRGPSARPRAARAKAGRRFSQGALAAALVFVPTMAEAYIGPGVGAGALAAVLGVIGSIFLAIFVLVFYPIKRLLKGRKAKSAKAQAENAEAATASASGEKPE